MIGVMVPNTYAEKLGIECPNVSPTSNYEMVFECNKKVDVNTGVLESMFEDINFVAGLFSEAKLYNIKQNANGGTAIMGIDVKITELKSEIKFVKSNSHYQIDFLSGKLAGSQMIISTSPTFGFDGTPDMGTDVSLTFNMKNQMCLDLIITKKCAEPNEVMYVLDKGLAVIEPKAKKIQNENPEFIILPTTETDVIPNEISPPKTSVINKETFEKLKEDPEVIKAAKEFDSQPEKKYFPEPIVTQKTPEEKNVYDDLSFGVKIELDQSGYYYTPTDRVYITIHAPALNQNPDEIETMGDDTFSTLTISTDRHYLSNYKLVESGPDTGNFIGQITLVADNYTSGMGPENGKLSAYFEDDELHVWLRIVGLDFIESVPIESTIGEIMWIDTSYGTSDTATIRVIDPDMNRNPDLKDTVMVKVYSNSDFEGKFVKLTEVLWEASAIFEGDVSFSSTPEDGKLLVSPNDILIAEFEDTILPQPYYKTDSLFIIGESKISTENLQLTADKEYYVIGDMVRISGEATSNISNINLKVIDPNGDILKMLQAKIDNNNLFSTSFKIEKPFFPLAGDYEIIAWQSQSSQDMNSITITIGVTGFDSIQKKGIPNWIKNNAEWWSQDQINDGSFIQGLQFLIQEKIIQVESKSQKSGDVKDIPTWIKNNAEWWANGTIDDSTFLSGIEYLVNEGIIIVR